MSLGEPVEDVAVEGDQNVQVSTARPDGRRRRRLSNDDEREIARLYAETMPTSQIRERFGIGDSSLYRAVQRQGVALRGRTATGTRSKAPQVQIPAPRRRRLSGTNRAQQAVSQPRSTAATASERAQRRVAGRSGR